MSDRPAFPCPRCTDPDFCAMEDCRHGIADTPEPDAMAPATPAEAVAFDIVARLRRGICADVCRFQNAASGCECAEAADEIVLLRTGGGRMTDTEHTNRVIAATDPAYDRAHHIAFAVAAAREAARLIETGDVIGAHHALEGAMNDVGAVLDIDGEAGDGR